MVKAEIRDPGKKILDHTGAKRIVLPAASIATQQAREAAEKARADAAKSGAAADRLSKSAG
jgi:hypothetical protein